MIKVVDDTDNKIYLPADLMNDLGAKEGDFAYISDARWYLGGIKSTHAYIGKMSSGNKIEISKNVQNHGQFDPSKKTIEIIQEVAEVIKLKDGSQVSASQLLNQFLFPPKVQHTLVGKLSGGEKKRLQLLRVLMKNPNFLILDEPTNDLDINTLNILEDYLSSFDGCLIIVSHDRYFMDKLVEHLFIFEGDGIIKDFPGNYSDYRTAYPSQDKQKKQAKTISEPKEQTKKTTNEKLTYNEKREFESLMKDIERLESDKAQLLEQMNETSNFEELQKFGQKIEALKGKIEVMELRWLELSEKANLS